MYTLLVCGDLYGEKVNLEITFNSYQGPPTIGELHKHITKVFSQEAVALHPPGFPQTNFEIARLQIYDDVMLKWTDLVSSSQMHEYDQIYCFQPQSAWHVDVQKDLPPPRQPSYNGGSSGYAQPDATQQYSYSDHSRSVPMPGNNMGNNTFNPNAMSSQLNENRQRELQLKMELARVQQENEAIEREAQQRVAEELRHKQAVIQRQREELRRMEEEAAYLAQQSQQRFAGRGKTVYN